LNIEKIDGTILTSLFLRNVSLTTGADTVLFAEKIELKTSPLQLLLKKIYVRKLEISNAFVSLKELQDSIWNIDQALKNPLKENASEVSDTTTNLPEEKPSPFPYRIVMNHFSLKNVDFSNKSFQFRDTTMFHPVLETDDLILRNLDLDLDAQADIAASEYRVDISHLSCNTNIGIFNLNELNCEIAVSGKYAEINDFYMLSDSTELTLSARLEKFNLFDSADLSEFADYPLKFNLTASPFNFDELTSFIGATDILKGRPFIELEAEGKFGDFNFTTMKVELGQTYFEATGGIKNLHTPSNFIVEAYVKNSNLHYDDAYNLLLPLDLPKFDHLYLTDATAYFQGYPTQFYATVFANTSGGKISGDVFLNTQPDDLEYDVSVETENLNAFMFVGSDTKINSSISIEGKGTSPESWDAEINCEINNSQIGNYSIDSLTLSAKAITLAANLSISGIINSAELNLVGDLDYNDHNIPKYDLTGQLEKLNLAKFVMDSTLQSNFNFDFRLTGENVNIDEISGNFVLSLENSFLNNRPIPDSFLELGLLRNDQDRNINLKSDFADFNINGNFALSDAIDLLTYESATIIDLFKQKADDISPFDQNVQSEKGLEIYPSIIDKDINIDYQFNFKDLSLIALFLNIDELDISGNGSGSIKNDSLSFSINTGIDFKYLLYKGANSFYLTNFESDLSFSRNNRSLIFDDLFGAVSVTGSELFAGTRMKDLYCDMIFNQKTLFINSAMGIGEDLLFEIEGSLDMSSTRQELLVNRLWAEYKNLAWENKDPIKIEFTDEYLDVKNLTLNYENAAINLRGKAFNNGNIDILFTTNNVPGIIFSRYLFDSNQNRLQADFDLSSSISGTIDEPKISAFMSATEVYYDKTNLGKITNQFSYNNRKLSTSFFLLDAEGKTKITAEGELPIYLGFASNKSYDPSELISIDIKTVDFNLNQFGNAIPALADQEGEIRADIKVYGDYDDLHYSGQIDIPDLQFRSAYNNLLYSLKFLTILDDDRIEIANFQLSNAGSTTYSGTLNGSGEIYLEGFNIREAELTTNGDLTVLSNISRSVSPTIYGDLFIGTKNDLKFIYKNHNALLTGSLLLKRMNLTYTLGSSGNSLNNDNFIYKIVVDSSKLDLTKLKVAKFLSDIDEQKAMDKFDEKNPFDFNLYMEIENDAKLEFILSKAANQKLIVYATGDLDFRTIDGVPNAQGEFILQPGSKLEYYKTFQADGSIRFESDITNPFLDVIATYTTTYKFNENESPEDIAVKMSLQGRVEEIGKNLAGNPENTGVYIGKRNIDNNVKDDRYDMADAFSMVLVGKFKNDLSALDQSFVQNTTGALIGSVLTNFANSTFGDYVSDIQINNLSAFEASNVTVAGKIQNVRYKIGTTINQLNNPNLRIEYLFNPNFLIRLERKEPIVKDFVGSKLITEFGLKYRFEF